MNRIASALAVVLATALASPSFAGDAFAQPDASEYFTARDRVGAHPWGLSPIDGRYPRPLASAYGMNIPAGAGAPVPVDPFALPRPYALGEAYVGYVVVDAKGNATHDAKGRAAWDGAGERMQFGY